MAERPDGRSNGFSELSTTGALVVAMLLLSACATAGGPPPLAETTEEEASEAPTASGRRSSKVLSRGDLETVYQYNALQAIELLRPNWLRSRGPVTIESSQSQGVRVYLDGNPRGYARDLAGILVSDIEEMRYLDSREATTRYGTGYPDGVIVIRTR